MDPITLAKIKGITVVQDSDGRVHWQSGGAVDADGANGQNGNPFSYRKDGKGLDANANAGWPDHGWRNVLIDDGTGHPTDDGHGNWYSSTTIREERTVGRLPRVMSIPPRCLISWSTQSCAKKRAAS